MNERSSPLSASSAITAVSGTLKFSTLHGTDETIQRDLGTTCSRTARKRRGALRQAWGM